MKKMLFLLIALVLLNGCIIKVDDSRNREDSLKIASSSQTQKNK